MFILRQKKNPNKKPTEKEHVNTLENTIENTSHIFKTYFYFRI